MPLPTKPTDLYVVNGWYIEMPGLIAPHFETLDGIAKNGSTVNIVDAGGNKRMSFSGQIMEFGSLSLTRTKQGSVDDAALEELIRQCIHLGLKFNAAFVKMHNQQEVFRIAFKGFRFAGQQYPTQDINSGEKFLVSYSATCDDWDIV